MERWKLFASLVAVPVFGIVATLSLGAATPAGATIPAGYGEGSGFCATVTASGANLGANYDNVWACGPIPGPTGAPGYGDAFESSPYGFQCTELANRFLWDVWGINPVFGQTLDGASFATAVAAANHSVRLTPNGTPSAPYLPGDIVSFTDGGDGHVAVVTKSTEDASGDGIVTLMEEDASKTGKTSAKVTHWLMASPTGSNEAPLDFDALASAPTPAPTVTPLSASPATLPGSGGTVTLSATVTDAASCTFTSNRAVVGLLAPAPCSDGTVSDTVSVPANIGKRAVTFKFTLAVTGTRRVETKTVVKVAARGGGSGTGIKTVVSDGDTFCAILSSGGVDCWGSGYYGELGNGVFYTTGNDGNAAPVAVLAVGGQGTLTGAIGMTSDGYGFCALLSSGGIDCWGRGDEGQLGNGSFSDSATPVAATEVGGTGILTGVVNMTSDDEGHCAVLLSGGVDCWGYGYYGDLGNGATYTTGKQGSATPVAVMGSGGTGTLSGVATVTGGGDSYCALLTSSGEVCWGYGIFGQLGNGEFSNSATPVAVLGIGGTGNLTDVVSLTSNTTGFCALLISGGIDCWGSDDNGTLGNGAYSTNSATPVAVLGIGGTGNLTKVVSLASDNEGYCAVLSSGGVDCWGSGYYGELGNGVFYTSGSDGSAAPVAVSGVGGTGILTGVLSVASNQDGFCAVLSSGGADCWGYGYYGELGNGVFYTSGSEGSATPTVVTGVGGSGILAGVESVTDNGYGGNIIDGGFCAVLSPGGVACWGWGPFGQLGNGIFYTTGSDGSATPVVVTGVE